MPKHDPEVKYTGIFKFTDGREDMRLDNMCGGHTMELFVKSTTEFLHDIHLFRSVTMIEYIDGLPPKIKAVWNRDQGYSPDGENWFGTMQECAAYGAAVALIKKTAEEAREKAEGNG